MAIFAALNRSIAAPIPPHRVDGWGVAEVFDDRSLMKYRRILNPQKAAEREIIGVLDLYLDFYKYKLQSLQRNSTTNYEAVEKHLAVFGNKKAALVTGQQCVAFFKNFSNYAIGTRRSYLAILRAC